MTSSRLRLKYLKMGFLKFKVNPNRRVQVEHQYDGIQLTRRKNKIKPNPCVQVISLKMKLLYLEDSYELK